MVLFSLINISLDISANVSWWVIKNTFYGTYYLVSYIRPPAKTKEEIELIELRKELSLLNKKLHMINNIDDNQHIITRYQYNNQENTLNNLELHILDDDFIIINNDSAQTTV
jgi:hypothetical protein